MNESWIDAEFERFPFPMMVPDVLGLKLFLGSIERRELDNLLGLDVLRGWWLNLRFDREVPPPSPQIDPVPGFGWSAITATPTSKFLESSAYRLMFRHDRTEIDRVVFPERSVSLVRSQTRSREISILGPPVHPSLTQHTAVLPDAAKEEEIQLLSRDGTVLAGTRIEPGEEESGPIAILAHGSGPETRDSGCSYEERDVEKSPIDYFRRISFDLAERGIASIRYDKRGVGQSGGNIRTASRSDLVEDLLAAVDVAAEDERRPIVLLGFSEGAGLALSAAARNQRIRGIVSIGGPARTIDEVILAKLRYRKRPKGEIEAWREVFSEVRRLRSEHRGERTGSSFRNLAFDWWGEHLETAPETLVSGIRIPVLILHGNEDADVLVDEARRLQDVMCQAKIQSRLVIFDGLNHLLGRACPEIPGFEYSIPRSIDPAALEVLVEWIKTSFGGRS